MNKLNRAILACLLLGLGSEASLASAVDLDQDTQLVKTANTQFSSNATLEQVFAAYSLFKEVEWRTTPMSGGRNSTVQVIGTYDLDKFIGLPYEGTPPQTLIDKSAVDAFKAEYSSVQYIINFSVIHVGAGTAVKVDSTSFNMIIDGNSNFFPDKKLLGFRDVTLNNPPQFIISALKELDRNNATEALNQISTK